MWSFSLSRQAVPQLLPCSCWKRVSSPAWVLGAPCGEWFAQAVVFLKLLWTRPPEPFLDQPETVGFGLLTPGLWPCLPIQMSREPKCLPAADPLMWFESL